MSTLQLENEIIGILKSSGLKRNEIQNILQNVNKQLQDSDEDDDFFIRLKNDFEAQTLNSSSTWLTSDEVDLYL
jgi:hypothetical protein